MRSARYNLQIQQEVDHSMRLGILQEILCLTWLTLVSFGPSAFAAEPYVVGVISPMTGPMATVGAQSTAGLQVWAQGVNTTGGIKGRQIELDICDDQGTPESAVNCARHHIQRGVVIILDNSVSSTIRAITPLLKEGPVMIVVSPIIEPDPKGYVFQTTATDLEITRALVPYLKASNVKKLAMIAATDTTGEANATNAQKVFPPSGIKLSLARIDLKSNDASIQLANVVNDSPIIYSAYSGAGAATVVKSFNNLGLTIPFVLSNANPSDAFMALIKDDLPPRLLGLGLNFMVPELIESAKQRARLQQFQAVFQQARKETPSLLALMGVTLADTAEAVLRNVDNPYDSAANKAYLETAQIESIAPIKFSVDSHVGMSASTISVVEYKRGHWTKADPIK
jgi:ABC-type branched-subunit amino acid transport system substrate-binding protein